jgi:hypothetical protein
MHCHENAEYDHRCNNGQHIHKNFNITSQQQPLKIDFEFLFAYSFNFVTYNLLPSVVLHDTNAAEIFVDAFTTFIGPKELIFPKLKSFLHKFLLKVESN